MESFQTLASVVDKDDYREILHGINISRDGFTTLAGTVGGGYASLAAGTAMGGKMALIGTAICPGIGTVLGGLAGVIAGAALGATAGHTVGKLIDENVARVYCCPKCGYQWRA